MKTQLLIKTDKKLKEGAQKVAKEMGLPLSVIVNNYLKKFVSEKEISFKVPLKPTKKLAKILEEADADIKAGKNLIGPFDTAKEMIKELKS